jgi:hypothetical protein
VAAGGVVVSVPASAPVVVGAADDGGDADADALGADVAVPDGRERYERETQTPSYSLLPLRTII